MKSDLDPLVVEIAIEIEQMGFEELLLRREGRTHPKARDARMLAPVLERHPDCIDPVPRPLIVAEAEVGRRKAKLAAARVAALDHALDRIVAAQHAGR